jgi:probable O-glycosylation ligase (exosortase A-associated)
MYGAFKRPFIGLGLWIWTAMFFPNAWVYGIASGIRYNLLISAATIFTYIFSKPKNKLELGSTGVLLLMFLAWTTFTSIYAMAPSNIVWDFWNEFLKTTLLFVLMTLAILKKRHIDFFLWCLVLSIGFYAALEGLKFIASGGAHKIEGLAGHTLGDRNELAVAFSMMLPITFYLLEEFGKKSVLIRAGLIGLILLLVISIIGTLSRGGAIALSVVGVYLFLKSKRKILLLVISLILGSLCFGLIPSDWFTRMDTMHDIADDSSFMGRVVAWKLSFILATLHPFVGGGFKSLEFLPVWVTLSQSFGTFSFFPTGNSYPDPNMSHAAHSIYFQVLGEHGFVGLLLFLSILVTAFRKAGKVAKTVAKMGGPTWIINLSVALRLTIFTYCVGGAALSFAYFDMTYAVCALVIVLEKRILPAVSLDRKTI